MHTQENVTFATAALRQLLYDLNINIKDLNIEQLGLNGELMVSWETKKGSYRVPVVYNSSLITTFKLNNFSMRRDAHINSFADTMLYSIIYNMGAANDTDPVEFFFQALCAFWDQFFIDTIHNFEFRTKDAMRYLKKLVYKNPTAEIDPHKWINNPSFFVFFISSPSGNTLYYSGKLNERKDLKREREGEMF
jgi:hypothetical protein